MAHTSSSSVYTPNNPYGAKKTISTNTECLSTYMADFGGGYTPYMVNAINDESIVDYLTMLASPLFAGSGCYSSIRFDYNGTHPSTPPHFPTGNFSQADFLICDPLVMQDQGDVAMTATKIKGTVFADGSFAAAADGTITTTGTASTPYRINTVSGSILLKSTQLKLNGVGYFSLAAGAATAGAIDFYVTGRATISTPAPVASPLMTFRLIAVLGNGFALQHNAINPHDAFIDTALQSIVNMMPNSLRGLTASYTISLKS